MEEARPRFVEAAQIIVKALANEVFSYEGEYYQIPPTSIRPRPISHPERRFYASSVSPESAEIMAKLGFGVLINPQNVWTHTRGEVERYRTIARSVGLVPRPPISILNISVAPSREEALERAHRYMGAKWTSIDNHYHFSDGHLATVQGYEYYGRLAKTYTKLKDASFRDKATDFYAGLHVVGTPQECLDQISQIQHMIGLDHVVTEFGYGGMPHEEAEQNMRFFASEVMPVLQHDSRFTLTEDDVWGENAWANQPEEKRSQNIFVPA